MNAVKQIRRLNRYRTITSILARSGFGYIAHLFGRVEKGSSELRQSGKTDGKRLRLLLQELGTTFIKLGQIASTRPDLFPPEMIAELAHLQDDVSPFPYQEVERIIEQELGGKIEELFKHFSPIPLASASIGQVHRAMLYDGTEVVVKVQRPRIASVIETDLQILNDLVRLASWHMEAAESHRLGDVVEELGKGLLTELDYRTEAFNLEKFSRQSKALGYVRIPAVYWDYCTRKVLTMEYLDGIRLSDREQLQSKEIDKRLLAERLATAIFHQVLVDGVFHADPHPGNILVRSDGSIVLLDFGMVGRLSPHTQKHLVSFIIALRNQSSKGVIRAVTELGMVPENVDMSKLYADVDEMREKYYNVPLKNIRIGEMINDFLGMAFRHQIRIPSELTLVGKSILTTEGVVAELDPSFSVFDVAEPIGKKLYIERLSPWQLFKNWVDNIPDYLNLINEIPMSLKQLTVLVKRGKLQIEVSSPQIEVLIKKMDRISNQVSFSIVILAVSIVLLGLLLGAALNGAQPVLWRLPFIEISAAIVLLMFMWLIYSIIRSGRF